MYTSALTFFSSMDKNLTGENLGMKKRDQANTISREAKSYSTK